MFRGFVVAALGVGGARWWCGDRGHGHAERRDRDERRPRVAQASVSRNWAKWIGVGWLLARGRGWWRRWWRRWHERGDGACGGRRSFDDLARGVHIRLRQVDLPGESAQLLRDLRVERGLGLQLLVLQRLPVIELGEERLEHLGEVVVAFLHGDEDLPRRRRRLVGRRGTRLGEIKPRRGFRVRSAEADAHLRGGCYRSQPSPESTAAVENFFPVDWL